MRREQRERRSPVMLLQHQYQQQQQHHHPQQWQAKGGFPGAYPTSPPAIAKPEDCYAATSFSPATSPAHMKDPLLRTKAVVRGLPPNLTHPAFAAQIDAKFAGSYSWLNFRPGKVTARSQVHSRAYIDFRRPLDVIAFHEEFDGHVFVNEKGAQFKAVVEYAPFQRVPDVLAKKDGREGTILKDPDYLEFLEALSKPVELLPSAEVQLDRRESDRLGSSKESPIVTPLMEFVRQKRAAKLAQRAAKSGGFRSIMGPAPSGYSLQKRGEKGKQGAENPKDGPGYGRRGRRRESAEKKFQREAAAAAAAAAAAEEGSSHKEPEAPAGADGEDAQRKDHASRKYVKEKDKNEAVLRGRPPVSPAQPGFKQSSYRNSSRVGSPNDACKLPDVNGDGRRVRNKDRPDRPVWTPRRRLDTPDPVDAGEGISLKTRGGRGPRTSSQEVNEPENELDRNGAFENGTYRTGSRKVLKDSDIVSEAGKHLKRGAAFGNNEKQVWVAVQKTG